MSYRITVKANDADHSTMAILWSEFASEADRMAADFEGIYSHCQAVATIDIVDRPSRTSIRP